MKVNNPNRPKFPLLCNNGEELIYNQTFLNKCGYEWRPIKMGLADEWRKDFRDDHYPLELRLFNNDYDKKEVTIHSLPNFF